MKKASFPLIFICQLSIVILLFSCNNSKTSEPEENTQPEIETPTSDTIYIGETYPVFPSDELITVLDSMRFCGTKAEPGIPDSLQLYPCTPELFGVFNNTSKDWKNGFLLEAMQGIWAKSSRVFNVELVDGIYLVTNDFKGQLLYLVPRKGTKHDIVLRYYDSQVGTVAIEHQWKGKSYKPVNVIMLNDYPIKKEFQDSLNHVYLDNFVWGY